MPDDLVSISDVPAHVPGPRRISRATVVRWHRVGVRGRILPTVLVGGRRFVSLAALREFINRDDPPVSPTVNRRKPKGRGPKNSRARAEAGT
jgi:hypothetical protein